VLLAGLDIGTSSVKGLALRPDGTIAARADAAYPLSTPRPGWAEQDPEDWWRAASAVLDELRAAGPLAGIGLSGQMHGLVLLDAAGNVLRPAILWNDGRTGAETAWIEERVGGRAELVRLTGNRALAGFTAPKLEWVRRHEPDVYARIARIMLPKDYVRLRLCGEHAIDVADASGTLWLDVRARAWSDAVLGALDVDPGWLPRLLESPEVSGETADGVPVAAGAGDQAAGAVGVGVERAGGPLSVVLGTSGVVFAALDDYAADPEGRVHAFCHALPGAWHGMGVMLSAAGSLAWLRATVAPEAGYPELDAAAAAWEPGVEGLTFLPYLAGERTPHADPDARGSFTGLSLRHDRGALVRAVLEGVAYGLRDSLDLVTAIGGTPEIGRVSGGGAASDLWLRIIASVFELPLQTMEVEEGAAFGAAILGGVAGGVFDDVEAGIAACVRPGRIVEPEPAWIEPYREGLARFRALYPAIRSAGPDATTPGHES
jgi:xylulokinase